MTTTNSYPLDRRDAVATILGDPGDMLVVSGLSTVLSDVFLAGDRPLNFYLRGAMGCALSLGLGLAIAQPDRRVLVVTGDGEILLGAGSLATVAAKRPGNLGIVVIDNERFGETGNQPTHTAYGVDIAAMAAAAGFPVTGTVADRAALDRALPDIRDGACPSLHVIKVSDNPYRRSLPPRDGVHLKNRFREAVLGPDAIQ